MRGQGKKGDFSPYALHIFLEGQAEEGEWGRSITDMEFHGKNAQIQENEKSNLKKKLLRKSLGGLRIYSESLGER